MPSAVRFFITPRIAETLDIGLTITVFQAFG